MKKYLILSLLLIIVNSIMAQYSTYPIDATDPSFDESYNQTARDTIYIQGDVNGERNNIYFKDITGAPNNSDGYTYIVNKSNIPVVINGTTTSGGGNGFCIVFRNCTNFVLTSSTNTSDPYGIKLYTKKNGAYTDGISFDGKCHDFIIENIEIYGDPNDILVSSNNTAGIYINDPLPYYHVGGGGCAPQNIFERWGNYIDLSTNIFTEGYFIENVILRNNYIHDVGKEGMYIGHSYPYQYSTLTCGQTSYKIFWAELKNIQVYGNITENTGATGIKISNDSLGIVIHDNVIKNYGLKDGMNNAGIFIGGGTFQASVYNNWIENGTGEGIGSKSSYDINIFNNVIKDAGNVPNTDDGHGIYINWYSENPVYSYSAGNGYSIYNNTIIDSEEDGIYIQNSWPSIKKIFNNIIVHNSSNTDINIINGLSTWTNSDNYGTDDISDVKFIDALNSDYNLSMYSPCIDNAFDYPIEFDQNYKSRPTCYGLDKGAFETSILQWQHQTSGSTHTIVIPSTTGMRKVDLATNQQVPLEDGDIIGVFYMTSEYDMACGGYAEWSTTSGTTVIAYGESSTGADDGFEPNERITWVIHDKNENIEYSAWGTNLSYDFVTFTASGNSQLFELVSNQQKIELGKTWDYISTYIHPLCPEIEFVLKEIEPYVDEIQRYKNGLQNGNQDIKQYIPDVINEINDIIPGEGFKIHMNELTHDLRIIGAKVPYNYPILLEDQESLFGYLRYTDEMIETMIANVATDVMYVKDDVGFIYFPGWVNQIGEMKPGEGYYCKLVSNPSNPVTLIYPNTVTKTYNLPMEKPEISYYQDYFKTYNTMGLGIPIDSWDYIPDHGDEIGVFDSQGNLCGAAVFESKNIIFLVHGDDKSSNIKEGLNENEKFAIKVYNSFSGIEREFKVPEWIEGSEKYENDGISIAGKMQEIVPESVVFYPISPNPCKDNFKINFYLLKKESIKVNLFDMFGSKIDNIISKELTKGYHSYNYQLGSLSPGTYLIKLSSKSYNTTKKIVIL